NGQEEEDPLSLIRRHIAPEHGRDDAVLYLSWNMYPTLDGASWSVVLRFSAAVLRSTRASSAQSDPPRLWATSSSGSTERAFAREVSSRCFCQEVVGIDTERSRPLDDGVERHVDFALRVQPGNLIYAATPDGVAAVFPGDTMEGGIAKFGTSR